MAWAALQGGSQDSGDCEWISTFGSLESLVPQPNCGRINGLLQSLGANRFRTHLDWVSGLYVFAKLGSREGMCYFEVLNLGKGLHLDDINNNDI